MAAGVRSAATFLSALFDAADIILFRPVETWIEAGKKRTAVDYRSTVYRFPKGASIEAIIRKMLTISEEKRLNIFFGVCPRFGGQRQFDLAWQIRTVRALWTDIDHVSVEEVRERIAKAGVPAPSIIVNSGNGVHLYWLLDAPYLIDDVGDPPSVETEWTQAPDGRKKPRKYIVENGDKVYLDQRRHASRLSPKGEHLQDVLAGVAKALGGDHTTDLSRLLRLPGTLNRKDQRNGREPAPTALVECDPTRKYPLAVFEPLKSPSAESLWAKQIAAMPLPKARKATAAKGDKLEDLVAACAVAPVGSRSEADFSLCCFAVKNGIGRAHLWTRVEQVGKFAEQGQRYFDITWDNAEYDARVATLDKLQKKAAPKACAAPIAAEVASDGCDDAPPLDVNVDESGAGRPTVIVDPQNMPVADTLRQVTNQLLATGNCFSRAEQLVAINGERISPVLSAPELAGLLNQHVEFYFTNDEAGEYKPFPPSYANTWPHQQAERGRLPVIKLFTRNPVYTDDWRLAPAGFDAPSGIFYAGPAIKARDDTQHLDALLKDFCFQEPADRTNYLGVLLTAILIPRFIGSKPAALFNGNQPELGKSILRRSSRFSGTANRPRRRLTTRMMRSSRNDSGRSCGVA